ncbi:NDP-sugar epimerase, includes UDP-GlcNAc-inverting 4,6-dehydratase FlaA1 and capsular polysaccharide biosynthesis protein EpsC [Balnearium lithotrophicum]|uniref:NDP-sugar epimerase, includes UDP-GlcNAc-inverting 4,6-dehydratase FlaA1 and capsular polysaccharide biosynthesis protein EpsC n=1 Tax=Balnearium lithotrophicum TaxID=223788 RepID=A0A521C755_9BACT|nr:nucleoside-diphosphate sugar epimerase/dehydratase [Balnearium lithotrophicum]SMO55244.1 NDP-sugar epimerase, includes UDP-GlcNAc-inverting 4,6-dehydratase FlaA1 and capsular polysaccharide biosynthesis protein EpsC [Balnearium lithotrophicum]
MKNKLKTWLKPTKKKRLVFFLLSDTLIFILSFIASFLLRFEFVIPQNYKDIIILWLSIFVIFKVFFFYLFRIYSINWRFVSIKELLRILGGLSSFSLIVFIINSLLQMEFNKISIPQSVVIIDFLISLVLAGFLRISKRIYLESFKLDKQGKNTLIVGAGTTGERIARGLLQEKGYKPIAFVDDDPNKIGTEIHGIPVLGKINDIPEIVSENKIEVGVIAIPSLNHKAIRKIYNILRNSGVKETKIIPALKHLPDRAELPIKDLKDISIEDLLFREEVKIERERISDLISKKKILVTGAGGSIGSEIVRQLIEFNPDTLIALEIDETELHNLTLELSDKLRRKGANFIPIVADVRDKKKLERIFQNYKPDIIFHAAAYKHVPLMEYFPEEAVKTNIFGTYNLAELSVKYGVKKFVNISTDKAVNPTSIMGATKRFAEIICNSFNQLGKTKFISVRFGNVLGSRGSVIPIFLEQIKKGGPVTVTHPEMKRYFMTIPEAVLLVFQAAAMGNGGEVFVLDMGEPVKIVTLAEELIKMQGLEPYKDIDIVFTGLRPGEKLFEELLTAEEGTEKTYHSKIYIARNPTVLTFEELKQYLDNLEKIVEEKPDLTVIKRILSKVVPFYNITKI